MKTKNAHHASFACRAAAVALCAAAAAPAYAAITTHSNENDFRDAMLATYRESFETAKVGKPVTELDFGANFNLPVSTQGVTHNKIHSFSDGFGAVNHDGERFWKIIRGATTIDLASLDERLIQIDSIAFYYSDLEWSDIDITLHHDDGTQTYRLDDHNPKVAKFLGLTADKPFHAVTFQWTKDKNDGVGFDRMMLGATALHPAVPAPATIGLATLGALLTVKRRRA